MGDMSKFRGRKSFTDATRKFYDTIEWKDGMRCSMVMANLSGVTQDGDFTCIGKEVMNIPIDGIEYSFEYITIPEGYPLFKTIATDPDNISSRSFSIEDESQTPNFFYNLFVATAYAAAETATLAKEIKYQADNVDNNRILANHVNVVAFKVTKPIKLISLMHPQNLKNIIEICVRKISSLSDDREASGDYGSEVGDQSGLDTRLGINKLAMKKYTGNLFEESKKLVDKRTSLIGTNMELYQRLIQVINAATGYGVKWTDQVKAIKDLTGFNLSGSEYYGFCNIKDKVIGNNCNINKNIKYEHRDRNGALIAEYGDLEHHLNRISIPSLDTELSQLLDRISKGHFNGFYHADVPSYYNSNKRHHSEICIFKPYEYTAMDPLNEFHLGAVKPNEIPPNIKDPQEMIEYKWNVYYDNPYFKVRQNYDEYSHQRNRTRGIFFPRDDSVTQPVAPPSIPMLEYNKSIPMLEYNKSTDHEQFQGTKRRRVAAAEAFVGGCLSDKFNDDQKKTILEYIDDLLFKSRFIGVNCDKVRIGCKKQDLYLAMERDIDDSKICTIL
jgi:hypothetical protein